MITVHYHVNTSGVLFQYSDNSFILRDGEVSFDHPALKELLSRGGRKDGVVHVPETPTTRKLLRKIRGAISIRRYWQSQRKRRRDQDRGLS